MGKKKVFMPNLDNDYIHINDVEVGKEVYYGPNTVPYKVVSKKKVEITVIELQNNFTKLKISGNLYVSKTPEPFKIGSESAGEFK